MISDVRPVKILFDISTIIQDAGLEKLRNELYLTGEALLDAYVLTFILGLIPDRLHHSNFPGLHKVREIVLKNSTLGPDNQTHFARFYRSADRTFLYTVEGFVGFGPQLSRPGTSHLDPSVGTSLKPPSGDIVYTFLGGFAPIVLRQSGGSFHVVGECYLHGFMDRDSMLGTLPSPWKVKLLSTAGDRHLTPQYLNRDTKSVSMEDPRLDDLPPEWEKFEQPGQEWTPDLPLDFAPHRNRDTGEIINSDPPLLPEALTA